MEGGIDLSPITKRLSRIREMLEDLASEVQGVANRILAGIQQTLQSIIPRLADAVGGAIAAFGGLVDGLLTNLTSLDELDGWLRNLFASNQPGVTAWLSDVIGQVASAAVSEVFGGPPRERETTQASPPPPPVPPDPTGGTVGDLMRQWREMPGPARAFVSTSLALLALGSYASALYAGDHERYRQASVEQLRPTLPPPETVAQAWRRQIASPGLVVDWLSRHGYDSRAQETILRLTEAQLGPDQLVLAWVRGLVSDGDLAADLGRLGYDDRAQAVMRGNALAVASPSDVVMLAGREAFEDEQARLLGLDAEYDTVDWSWAERVGLREPWRRFYWRAHWQTVSNQQLFAMRQRDIIGDDLLDAGLRANEYTPQWRDKLLQLSYDPLTRVDVRRMHDLGVLDRAGVVRAYRDAGYSPANAERLADFSERLVVEHKQARVQELHGSRRSELLRQYEAMLTDGQSVRAALAAMGYEQERIDADLAAADERRRAVRRDATRDGLERLFVQGYIGRQEAAARLRELGLGGDEVADNLAVWSVRLELRERQTTSREQRDLTRTDVLAAYSEALIDRPTATTRLLALHYDMYEADELLALADERRDDRRRADIERLVRAQYVAGRVSRGLAAERLAQSGIALERATLLLERWEVDRDSQTPDVPLSALQGLLAAGRAETAEVGQELRRRGYTNQEAGWLIDLWQEGIAVDRARLDLQRQTLEQRERLQAQRLDAGAARQQTAIQAQAERDARLAQAREQQASAQRAHQLSIIARQLEANLTRDQARLEGQRGLLTQRGEQQLTAIEAQQRGRLELQERRDALTRELATERNAIARERLQIQVSSLERRIAADEARQARALQQQDKLVQLRDQLTREAENRRETRQLASERRGELRSIATEQRAYARTLEQSALTIGREAGLAAGREAALVQGEQAIRSVIQNLLADIAARYQLLGAGTGGVS